MRLFNKAMEEGVEEGIRKGLDRAMPRVMDLIAKIAMDVCFDKFGEELRRLQTENLKLKGEIFRMKLFQGQAPGTANETPASHDPAPEAK